jgi:hypothetical protein
MPTATIAEVAAARGRSRSSVYRHLKTARDRFDIHVTGVRYMRNVSQNCTPHTLLLNTPKERSPGLGNSSVAVAPPLVAASPPAKTNPPLMASALVALFLEILRLKFSLALTPDRAREVFGIMRRRSPDLTPEFAADWIGRKVLKRKTPIRNLGVFCHLVASVDFAAYMGASSAAPHLPTVCPPENRARAPTPPQAQETPIYESPPPALAPRAPGRGLVRASAILPAIADQLSDAPGDLSPPTAPPAKRPRPRSPPLSADAAKREVLRQIDADRLASGEPSP